MQNILVHLYSIPMDIARGQNFSSLEQTDYNDNKNKRDRGS